MSIHESTQTPGQENRVRNHHRARCVLGIVTVAAMTALGHTAGADDIAPSQYGHTMGPARWQAADTSYPPVQALGEGVTDADAEMIVRGSPKVVPITLGADGLPYERDCGGLAMRDRDGKPQLYTAGHCVSTGWSDDDQTLRRSEMANLQSATVVPFPKNGASYFNVDGDEIVVRNTAPQETAELRAPAADDTVRLVMNDAILRKGMPYTLPGVNTTGLHPGDRVGVYPPQTEVGKGKIHSGIVEGAAHFQNGWMIVVDFPEVACPKGASGTGVFKLIPGAEPGAIGTISGYANTDEMGNPIAAGTRCLIADASINSEIARVFANSSLQLGPGDVVES